MKKYAFYLPQFHQCTENDMFWGEGFTDWVTTKNAKPLYEGHYQPKNPGSLGYYDLESKEVIYKQAKLARENNIDGFAIYYYRFDDDVKALYKPLQIILDNKDIEIDIFLCWVNADWTKSWVGEDKVVIFKQKYNNNYRDFFYETLGAFNDVRYVKIDNKPVFYIHDPARFDVAEFIDIWNKEAIENGYDGVFWIAPLIHTPKEKIKMFDYLVGYPPGDLKVSTLKKFSLLHRLLYKRIPKSIIKHESIYKLMNVFSYDEFTKKYLEYVLNVKGRCDNYIPTILPAWDNTPRYGRNGFVLSGSTPKNSAKLLSNVIDIFKDDDIPFILIKAWNEWAEGNVLEPDSRYKNSYLYEWNKHL